LDSAFMTALTSEGSIPCVCVTFNDNVVGGVVEDPRDDVSYPFGDHNPELFPNGKNVRKMGRAAFIHVSIYRGICRERQQA